MKALVYTGTEEITFKNMSIPEPQKGESRIKIEAVGICGSDMHAYHGKDERRVPPLILGHEAAGVVVSGNVIVKEPFVAVLLPPKSKTTTNLFAVPSTVSVL